MSDTLMRYLHRFSVAGAFLSLLWAASSLAAPPYDITVTFDPPITGGAPDNYNLYIDDCAAGPPVAAPYGTVISGQTFTGALTADGTFEICVRAENSAGLGPAVTATVVVADLPLPGPVENLDVQIVCPNGGCTVTVTVN